MKDNNRNNNELMARLTRRFDGREIVNWNGVEIYIYAIGGFLGVSV